MSNCFVCTILLGSGSRLQTLGGLAAQLFNSTLRARLTCMFYALFCTHPNRYTIVEWRNSPKQTRTVGLTDPKSIPVKDKAVPMRASLQTVTRNTDAKERTTYRITTFKGQNTNRGEGMGNHISNKKERVEQSTYKTY